MHWRPLNRKGMIRVLKYMQMMCHTFLLLQDLSVPIRSQRFSLRLSSLIEQGFLRHPETYKIKDFDAFLTGNNLEIEPDRATRARMARASNIPACAVLGYLGCFPLRDLQHLTIGSISLCHDCQVVSR